MVTTMERKTMRQQWNVKVDKYLLSSMVPLSPHSGDRVHQELKKIDNLTIRDNKLVVETSFVPLGGTKGYK